MPGMRALAGAPYPAVVEAVVESSFGTLARLIALAVFAVSELSAR